MPAQFSPTPPPRRTGALANRAAKRIIDELRSEAIAHKYRVLDSICIAKDKLGLKGSAVAVLRALVSFHPDETLRVGENLVVHPSNRLLQARANGMPETTLRRHLAALVSAGVIARRDSPNGKRYVRRGGEGTETYGFDLSLLVARADEFEALKNAVEAEARERRRLLDLVTIYRREVREAVTEALCANRPGHWQAIRDALVDLSVQRASRLGTQELETLVGELRRLGNLVDELLADEASWRLVEGKSDGNAAQNGRHHPESNPQPLDIEPRLQRRRGDRQNVPATAAIGTSAQRPQDERRVVRSERPLPMRLVTETFPAIRDYGRGGRVENSDELVAAAEVVRGALGISPDAWQQATAAMGRYEAAVAVAFILDNHGTIRSPGGYLRALTDRAGEGAFSAWALVLSTAKRRAGGVSALQQRR